MSYLVLALTLLSVVTMLSLRYPFRAFLVAVFVFTAGYLRAGFQLGSTNSWLYLGDVLWSGLILALFLRWLTSPGLPKLRMAAPWEFWVVVPFAMLGILLPVAGVALQGWPMQHATTAFRHAEWLSFAPLAYHFSSGSSGDAARSGRYLLAVMVVAGLAHLGYALVQLLAWADVLGQAWVALDLLYQAQHPSSWFFYPRLTGLLVNPNSFGLFGSFLLVIAAARLYRTHQLGDRLFVAALVVGVFAVVFSASRSAVLGLAVGLSTVGLSLARWPRRLTSWTGGATLAAFAAGGFLLGGWPLVPENLRQRFFNLIEVAAQGVGADPGFTDRVQMWSDLAGQYWTEFPLGTLVSPILATGKPVDSYYFVTALQGTPVYTLLFVGFLVTIVAMSRRLASARDEELALSGLTLSGWAGIMAGSSFGLSPMLQEQLIVPFWALFGIVCAGVTEPGTLRSTGEASAEPLDAPTDASRAEGPE